MLLEVGRIVKPHGIRGEVIVHLVSNRPERLDPGSVLSSDALRRAVASGDVAALTLVPGVGKKVAQRVVLDLKDKLGGDIVIVEGPMADVHEALLTLGLSPQEASEAMTGLAPNGDRSVEDLLREALQRVGRG